MGRNFIWERDTVGSNFQPVSRAPASIAKKLSTRHSHHQMQRQARSRKREKELRAPSFQCPQLKAGSQINRSTHGKKRSLACESAIPTHACLGGGWPRPFRHGLLTRRPAKPGGTFSRAGFGGFVFPETPFLFSFLSFGRFVVVKAAASIGCGLVTTSVDAGMEWRGLFPVPELSPRTSGLGHPLSVVMGEQRDRYKLVVN
jgi:hypothetical protein